MTSAPQGPVRARVPLAERREQVLDLALEVLVGEGFDALTMEAIARRAGVNRVVVYRAFANKGVLLVALLRRERRRTERQIDALMPEDPGASDPRAVLLDGLTGFLDAVAAAPLTWHLALLPPESAPQALRVMVDRRRAAVERRIRRLVAWGAERLDVPAGALDLEVLSRMILSLCEEQGRLLLEDERFGRERLIAGAEALLDAVAWHDGAPARASGRARAPRPAPPAAPRTAARPRR
jgi:AcrR family transcriptional regulator